ncbi:hypothetical protein AVDCRST_MAG82-1227, partial [uncultured Rubrobacteraceae bacterium]
DDEGDQSGEIVSPSSLPAAPAGDSAAPGHAVPLPERGLLELHGLRPDDGPEPRVLRALQLPGGVRWGRGRPACAADHLRLRGAGCGRADAPGLRGGALARARKVLHPLLPGADRVAAPHAAGRRHHHVAGDDDPRWGLKLPHNRRRPPGVRLAGIYEHGALLGGPHRHLDLHAVRDPDPACWPAVHPRGDP